MTTRALAILVIGLIGPAAAMAQDAAAPANAPQAAALTMPKWSEFPVAPTDVPTVKDIAARVAEQAAASKALTAEVAALKWDGDKPEAFKREALARLDPNMLKPVDKPMSQAAIEAMGAELRRKAVPPPVAY